MDHIVEERDPVLLVHGGAWEIPRDMHDESMNGCHEAAELGWDILARGGSSLQAVEAAVHHLEDNPTFDAGRGSVLNAAGEVELDAIIMDGSTLDLGAVMAVKHVSNPVILARLVMTESDHTILVADGAEAFARDQGMALRPNWHLVVERERKRWQTRRSGKNPDEGLFADAPGGTVGAVARDANGHTAAATSTGGTFYKQPGRVGDSPLIGCGLYADDWAGAISATGEGEDLMKIVIGKSVCDLLRRGMPAQEAAEAGIGLLSRRTDGRGGLIVVGKRGDVGMAHNTSWLAYAHAASGKISTGVETRGGVS